MKTVRSVSIDIRILEYFERKFGSSISFSEYVEGLLSKDLQIPITEEEQKRIEKIKELEEKKKELIKKMLEDV